MDVAPSAANKKCCRSAEDGRDFMDCCAIVRARENCAGMDAPRKLQHSICRLRTPSVRYWAVVPDRPVRFLLKSTRQEVVAIRCGSNKESFGLF